MEGYKEGELGWRILCSFDHASKILCGGILRSPLLFLCLVFTVLFLASWISCGLGWNVFLWEELGGLGRGLGWCWTGPYMEPDMNYVYVI